MVAAEGFNRLERHRLTVLLKNGLWSRYKRLQKHRFAESVNPVRSSR